MASGYRICTRTILDTSVPGITFNNAGECNFCDYYERLAARTINRDINVRDAELKKVIAAIKSTGETSKFDCILGVSGGLDSTYLALLAKDYGLRPLLVHFDNGWNSELAVKNIENIVTKLNYELHTFVMDWEEFKDLQRAYFFASVVDVEVPTDQLIFAALNRIAYRYGIKYILAGNNVACESINPAGWVYKEKLDLVNLRSIHNRYGRKKLKKLPRLGLFQRYFYEAVAGIQVVNILNLVDYNKNQVKSIVQEKLGWRDYGGKHYESVFTRFYQGYYLPVKFNIDKRRAHLSNLILSGQITRDEALLEITMPPYPDDEQISDLDYVTKKLGFTEKEWEEIINAPPVPHENFASEKDPWYQLFYFVFRAIMYLPVRVMRSMGLLHKPQSIISRW